MASIYKRPDSEIYQCQFYVKDPATGELSKVRKSTGKTNMKKAQLTADELERAAQGVVQAGSDRARQAKAIFAEVVRDVEREVLTAPAVRRYLSQLLAIATGEKLECHTLESWIAEWLRRKSRDSSPATMARYKSHTGAFLSWLGDKRRVKPLESVTSQDVRKWKESLSDGGRAGKSVLGYLKDVGAVYRSAMREGIVMFNPCGMAIGDTDTSDSHERRPFTTREIESLVAAAPSAEWRGLVLAAAFTGLRLGDAARLSWEAVDLAARKITVTPSKTRRKKRVVRIPIHPDLLAWLEAAPIASDDPAAPVFPTLAKTKVDTSKGLSASFVAIMAAAGVDRGKPSRVIGEGQAKGKGRVTWERGFHSLRHSFTSWLRNAGVSEEDRMDLTGHSSRESHKIYSHANEEAGRKAIEKLPRLKTAKP
ncbi:MAG: site-specific integrase [Verrucomicrobia bacterium]|nr:site-specific integrase [Verrucomicrobiota bacterium]